MDFTGIFALCGFAIACTCLGRVHQLERILRENGLGAKRTAGLREQIRKQIGNTVTLTVEAGDTDVMGTVCKILDADEDWALVLVGEGKKNECEKLIRLDSVKQIKVK